MLLLELMIRPFTPATSRSYRDWGRQYLHLMGLPIQRIALFYYWKPGHPALQAGQHPDHIGIGDAIVNKRDFLKAEEVPFSFRL